MKKCLHCAQFLFILFFISCTTTTHLGDMNIQMPAGTKQVILVTTNSWISTNGEMFLYERNAENENWKLIDSFPVNVGRNGLAWDNKTTMQKYGSARVKHEGDGCSPAGIFSLGPVFSYNKVNNLKMPFVQTDSNDICVDDENSKYYNTLIDADTVLQKDWNSNEEMKRNDNLYEYGVWVNYNTAPAMPASGSCIFLHIWKDENSPTSGCTSMSKENMLKLINWLDKNKNPKLIQYSIESLHK